MEEEEIDDKFAIKMIIEALRARDLYKSLRQKAPISYVAMIAKVEQYVETEEANR